MFVEVKGFLGFKAPIAEKTFLDISRSTCFDQERSDIDGDSQGFSMSNSPNHSAIYFNINLVTLSI